MSASTSASTSASVLPLLTCKVYPTKSGYRAFYGNLNAFGETEEQAAAGLRKKIVQRVR